MRHLAKQPAPMFPVEFEKACEIVAIQLDTDLGTARRRLLDFAEARGETPDVTAWAVTSRALRFRPDPTST
jgi:hypothetical protein